MCSSRTFDGRPCVRTLWAAELYPRRDGLSTWIEDEPSPAGRHRAAGIAQGNGPPVELRRSFEPGFANVRTAWRAP